MAGDAERVAGGSDAGPAERAFMADLAGVIEPFGVPRAAGLVLGWLLVSPEPEQSFADVRRATGLSAGSVSSATRLLETIGLVRRTQQPGGRALGYRVDEAGWLNLAASRVRQVNELRSVVQRGLDVVGDTEAHRAARLRFVARVYAVMEEELRALLHKVTALWVDEATAPGTGPASAPSSTPAPAEQPRPPRT